MPTCRTFDPTLYNTRLACCHVICQNTLSHDTSKQVRVCPPWRTVVTSQAARNATRELVSIGWAGRNASRELVSMGLVKSQAQKKRRPEGRQFVTVLLEFDVSE
jgi:hypothetical protein